MKYIVFMDTNIYDAANGYFSNTTFSIFKERIEAGIAELQINSVVEGETKKHIRERVKKAAKELKEALNNTALLGIKKSNTYSVLACELDPKVVPDEAVVIFDDFLNECNVKRISVNGIDVESIMINYFEQKLPFEPKKPEEFKDAIAIASIYEEIKKMKEDSIYCIVSNDKGFRDCFLEDRIQENLGEEYVNRVFTFPKLSLLLAKMTALDIQGKHIEHYIEQGYATDDIEERISDIIYEMDMEIPDVEPWVEDKEIYSVEKIDFDWMLLDVTADHKAVIYLDVSANVFIEYSYVDPNNSYYDHEDRAYYWKSIGKNADEYYIHFSMTMTLDVSECGKTVVMDEKTAEKKQDIEIMEVSDPDYDNDYIEVLSCDDYPDSLDLNFAKCLRSENIEYYDAFRDGDPIDTVKGAYTTCPDCGQDITLDNDGGNGFCIKCAPDH